MKSLLLVTGLLMTITALADTQIVCFGKTTDSRVQVELSGKFWLIDDIEYYFGNKLIPTLLNEASIGSDYETQKQSLVLRFKATKKHNKLKKNSNLKFSISQVALPGNDAFRARSFELSSDYQARLSLEGASGERLIDSLECQSKVNN